MGFFLRLPEPLQREESVQSVLAASLWNPSQGATAEQLGCTAMAARGLSSQRGAHLTALNPAAHRVQKGGVHFWIPLEVKKKKKRERKENKGRLEVESGTDIIKEPGEPGEPGWWLTLVANTATSVEVYVSSSRIGTPSTHPSCTKGVSEPYGPQSSRVFCPPGQKNGRISAQVEFLSRGAGAYLSRPQQSQGAARKTGCTLKQMGRTWKLYRGLIPRAFFFAVRGRC